MSHVDLTIEISIQDTEEVGADQCAYSPLSVQSMSQAWANI